jgi:hypothetical protein
LIISGTNHNEAIIMHDKEKIRIFFRFEILLNFIVPQYASTEIINNSKPTGPFVSVASPIEIPAKKAYLNPLFSPVSLTLFPRKMTERKIKKLKKGSIIPDLKYK